MSLIEALLGFPSTGDTKDIARERKCDGFTHQRIHINCVVSDGQFIAYRSLQLRAHFFDGASHVLGIQPSRKTENFIQHPIIVHIGSSEISLRNTAVTGAECAD